MTTPHSLTSELARHISQTILDASGWLGFDIFMDQALYTPGLGYYAHGSTQFGALPYTVQDGARVAGSDFVTSPGITPLFGWTLALQVAQALEV
ncbi:MAG: class I SAM-dependent methyltransferase, partial [Rhodoferax sp.]|nr:class I SAM-dependent methyltransferase [Rhodoferax sp.]